MDNIMRYLAVFFLFLAPVLVVPAFADASDISAASRSVVRVVVLALPMGSKASSA